MELVYAMMIFAFASVAAVSVSVSADQTSSIYIVLTNELTEASPYATQAEQNLGIFGSLNTLDSEEEDNVVPESIRYQYSKVLYGFAAPMSSQQADSLRQLDDVLAVYEDVTYELHTTHTPEFLRLDSEKLWSPGHHSLEDLFEASQDVIVGVLDTGVWPESPFFTDHNMSAIPSRWKGSCDEAEDFDPKTNCGNKLIGARSFVHVDGKKVSPRDKEGHGTHTASTAAGSMVAGADSFGYAPGNARGMANGARLAVYKVCSEAGCLMSDIIAGIEAAVHDGVDVLSISLGGVQTEQISLLAAATFTAMENGVFVSCSAGNNGPSPGSVSNGSPWIMTVGAGTIDRDFPALVTLDDNVTSKYYYKGVSLYSGEGMMGSKPMELVYGDSDDSRLCLLDSLEPSVVRGKVVICDRGTNARVAKGMVVKAAGGVGMILANTDKDGQGLVADSHLLPAVAVTYSDAAKIKEYLHKMGTKAKALLTFGGTVMNVRPAPQVASFSSRGPYSIMLETLKPDVIGPGVNILAGWTEAVGPTGIAGDDRKTKFNIVSGTSMSCPHISGLAALLKAAHPKWSPSAIKSALMTTAYTLDNTKSAIRDTMDNTKANPWDYGAGHVNIRRAMSPGLVYDAKPEDYIAFLCSLGIGIAPLQKLSNGNKIVCPVPLPEPGQLNYPSFSVLFSNSVRAVKQTRSVTNVGYPKSVYNVSVSAPPNVRVTVEPSTLVFEKAGENKNYTVTFKLRAGVAAIPHSFGSIAWVKRRKQVRSPVAFYWMKS